MENACCAECGLLGLRDTMHRGIVEAEADYRKTASIPSVPTLQRSGIAAYGDLPVCLARKKVFDSVTKDKRTAELSKRFRCPSFVEWQQGFSPKEHMEMQFQQKLIDAQRDRDEADRKWREQQAEAERRWRESQSLREHDWRQDDIKLTKSLAKQSIWATLLAALIGFSAAIAGVWVNEALRRDRPAEQGARGQQGPREQPGDTVSLEETK